MAFCVLGVAALAASAKADTTWETRVQFRQRIGSTDGPVITGNNFPVTATGTYEFTVQVGIFSFSSSTPGSTNHGLFDWTANANAAGLAAGETLGVTPTTSRVSPFNFGPSANYAGTLAGGGALINNIDCGRDISGGPVAPWLWDAGGGVPEPQPTVPVPGDLGVNDYTSVWRFSVVVNTLSGSDIVVNFGGSAGPIVQWQEFYSTPPTSSDSGSVNFIGLTRGASEGGPLAPYLPVALILSRGAPVGACCSTTTGACIVGGQPDCAPPNVWVFGHTCTPDPCPGAAGTCCRVDTGSCFVTAPSGCLSPNIFTGGAGACPSLTCLQAPPLNDTCANAVALSLGVPATGSNTTATNDIYEPCLFQLSTVGKGVWFSFVPPANGPYKVDTLASPPWHDTVLGVYTSADCTSFNPIACNDDVYDDDGPPLVTQSEIAGVMLHSRVTYYVLVSTDLGTTPDGGPFTVVINQDPSQCVPWTEIEDPPAPRRDLVCVYDSVCNRMVVFGGGGGPGLAPNTWTSDGGRWHLAATSGPSTRLGACAAFDSFRDRVVMFGGYPNALPVLSETWEWDGVAWSQRFPAHVPQIRSNGAMAYDPVRHKTVMFGGNIGCSGSPCDLNDTWEWDGNDWSNVTPADPAFSPSKRFGHAMAFDAASGRVLLFGGLVTNDTWAWNGTIWTQVSATGPTPRHGALMACDSDRQKVVLFGGNDYATQTGIDGTYEWDGSTWNQVNTVVSPGGRWGQGMCYDTDHHATILFGGSTNGARFNDTWTWNGVTWTKLGEQPPSPREYPAAAFDSVRNQTILFGGDIGSSTSGGETWIWNGTGWTAPSISGSTPSPRSACAMAFDAAPSRGNTVLFGGYTGGAPINETWIWNGSTWMLQPIPPPPALYPSARYLSSMAYDAHNQNVVLFGGFTSANTSETWTWNGEWTYWGNSGPEWPSARAYAAMAYDPVHSVVVLFGGYGDSGRLGDTWTWNGSAWSLAATSGPQPRHSPQMTFDASLGKVVLFSGSGGTSGADLWSWDGSAWTELAPPRDVLGRYGGVMVFDAAHNESVLFGGSSNLTGIRGGFGDTWLLHTQTKPRVTAQPTGDTSCPGGVAQFSATATASGTEAFTFVWRKGGAALNLADPRFTVSVAPDGRSSTLTITGLLASDTGSSSTGYDCVISTDCGSVTTSAAALAVCGADFNCSGNTDSDDLFDFLDGWFSQNGSSGPGLSADIDASGAVDSDDLFAFLDLWFAENGNCP